METADLGKTHQNFDERHLLEWIVIYSSYFSSFLRLGYHAEPSMNRLHLHVISDDLCSDCLKTKKHYNSFVTEHFIDSASKSQLKVLIRSYLLPSLILFWCLSLCGAELIESMKNSGKIISVSSQQCKALLNKPLVCFKCGEKMANMPKLKDHLHGHIKE